MPWSGPPILCDNPIADLLGRGLQADPNALAIVSNRSQWSWRRLDESSSRLAERYFQSGLQVGDRVASLMPNCPELVVHYLACLKSGLVATPLNYRYMPPELDHALEVSEAAMLLHHVERQADVAASRWGGERTHRKLRFSGEGCDGFHAEGASLTSGQYRTPPPLDLDSPAFLYFTSGSTGKPKGVVHTRRSFGWMLASTMTSMQLTS
ncbi:MAG: AMP-binding protein, partial [Blastopirellula sp. JB062]